MAPRIALMTGDPAGVGPELVAKLLADPAAAEAAITVITDRRVLEGGMAVAAVDLAFGDVASPGRPALLDRRIDAFDSVRTGVATEASGRVIFDAFETALDLARAGRVDALCFAPLNKTSLHLAGMQHEDELRWFAERLGHRGPTSELNVLDELWTSRVTSHIPLKDVAGLLTSARIVEAVGLLAGALRDAGVARPRIAVCGLNPHAGDNGNFGSEEIEVIEPAVAAARAAVAHAAIDGPFPADTVFVRAKAGAFDGVVTMYHDQGQIAMKLMGFERGVTVQGGLPLPIATPAHGTAFDIVGQGRANLGAMRNAFRIACRMGTRHVARQAA